MSFQRRVFQWVEHTFGKVKAESLQERNRRFFEESTELVQAMGMTKEECTYLIDYVYGRDVGEVGQELGKVSVTLHALAEAAQHSLDARGEEELARVWTCVDKIRERNSRKMGSVRHEVATEIAALACMKPWEIFLHQNLESDLGFSSYHRCELMAQFLHHGVDAFAAEAHGWRTVADVEQTFNAYKDAVSTEKEVDPDEEPSWAFKNPGAPFDLKIGDLVFASRWPDCDPSDPWSVGQIDEIKENRVHLKGGNRYWLHASRITEEQAERILAEYPGMEGKPGIPYEFIRNIFQPEAKDSFYKALHEGDLTP